MLNALEKSEWLNKHLPYRYLLLVAYLIEQKTKREQPHHVRICLIEGSYVALYGFLHFLLDKSLIEKKTKNYETDVTIDKLGGTKITKLTLEEYRLLNDAIETRNEHVAHFTTKFRENASDSLGQAVYTTIRLLYSAMKDVEGFKGSILQQEMINSGIISLK